MWTASQKPYYDVIRAEESKRRTRVKGGAITSTVPTTTTTARHAPPAPSPARDTTLEEQPKLLDPISALQLPCTDIKNVTELAFDRKGITGLHENMLHFEGLTFLSLQHNRLKSLHNLIPADAREKVKGEDGDGGCEAGGVGTGRCLPPSSSSHTTSSTAVRQLTGPRGCFRLKQLLLTGNRLRRLDLAHTDLPRLTSLEYVNLSHNLLGDREAVLRALHPLKCLTYLDLEGNPICEDTSYRRTVIARLPQVQVLDRVAVTDAERRHAAAAAASEAASANKERSAEGRGEVAFGSSFRPAERSQHTLTQRPAPKAWSKSQCVRMMEKRYAAHVQRVAADAAAVVEAEQREVAEAEAKKRGFHAVWELSRPGMPLSSSPLAGGGGHNAQQPSSATATGVTRKQGSVGGSVAAAAEAQGGLPAIHQQQQQQQMVSAEAYKHESVMYDALLGRVALAQDKGLHSVGGDAAAPVGAPPPPRLAELDAAIADANSLVKLLGERNVRPLQPQQEQQGASGGCTSKRGSVRTGSAGKAPRATGKGISCSNSTSFTVAPPPANDAGGNEVECDGNAAATTTTTSTTAAADTAAATLQSLTAALKAKARAFIPPPWEAHPSAPVGSGGSAAMNPARSACAVAEKLDAIVDAVSAVFLPQELQALESRFGPCELIAAVRASHGGGSASATTMAESEGVSGGRMAPGSGAGGGTKRPASQSGRKSARNAAATAAADADNARETLWAAITTTRTTVPTVGLPPSPSLPAGPAGATAAAAATPGQMPGHGSAAPSPASTSGGGTSAPAGTMNNCVVGPFAAATLSAFLSELQQRSGAWDLEVAELLPLLFTAYDVDPSTGKRLKSLPETAALMGAKASSSDAGAAAGLGGAQRGDGSARSHRGPNSSKHSSFRSPKSIATSGSGSGNGDGTSSERLGGLSSSDGSSSSSSGMSPSQRRSLGLGRAVSSTKQADVAPLTVNHLLASLAYYEPFLQQRAQYFAARCAEATAAAIRSGTVTASAVNPLTARRAATTRAMGGGGEYSRDNGDVDSSDSDVEDAAEKGTEEDGASQRPGGTPQGAAAAHKAMAAPPTATRPTPQERESREWFGRVQRVKAALAKVQATHASGLAWTTPGFPTLGAAR